MSIWPLEVTQGHQPRYQQIIGASRLSLLLCFAVYNLHVYMRVLNIYVTVNDLEISSLTYEQ